MHKIKHLIKRSLVSKICMIALLGFGMADDGGQIIIDPVTKKIIIVTGSGETIDATTPTSTGSTTTENTTTTSVSGANFAQTFLSGSTTTTGTTTSGTTQTGLVVDTTNEEETSTPPVQTSTTTGTTNTGSSEFEQALAWMYANGLTKFSTIETYLPDDSLTREQAAKIIGQAYVILGYPQVASNTGCNFTDSNTFDPSLAPHIANVCSRGLFAGSKGNFMAQQTLTRPQALAVLIRMMEGKKSNETKNPWWQDYFTKAGVIGLVDEYSFNTFDRPITRKEIALFVYRLKKVVEDENLRIQSLNQMSIVAPSETGAIDTSLGYTPELAIIAAGIQADDDPELLEAINWMYDNALTRFTSINEYKPFQVLLREEAAKMIVNFANLYADTDKLVNSFPDKCAYTDLASANTDLTGYIQQACTYGLLIGNNKKFDPKKPISKADFVVALIRLLEGKHLNETSLPWWKQYFQQAQTLDIVGPSDAITFEDEITRYEVALFLYRFKVKYLLLKNLNTDTLINEIMSMVVGSETEDPVSKLPKGNIYITSQILKDSSFTLGYLELFGTRYKVMRTKMETYFTNNFVWYGDVYDIVDDTKVGTLNLIVSNDLVVEGRVRFTDETFDYVISPAVGTNAYYTITSVSKK